MHFLKGSTHTGPSTLAALHIPLMNSLSTATLWPAFIPLSLCQPLVTMATKYHHQPRPVGRATDGTETRAAQTNLWLCVDRDSKTQRKRGTEQMSLTGFVRLFLVPKSAYVCVCGRKRESGNEETLGHLWDTVSWCTSEYLLAVVLSFS